MFKILALLVSLSGWVAAAERLAPMSPRLLTIVQGALAASAGARLPAIDPSLAAVRDLDPRLVSHREALAAMTAQLGPQPASAEILRAYYSPQNLAQMESVLSARTEELHAAATEGSLAPKQKSAAAAELDSLAALGDGVTSPGMAKAAASARKLAGILDATLRKTGDDPSIEWVPILEPRPMQFGVGMTHQVAKKRAMLEKMTPAQQRDYLLKHPIPVVERRKGSRHINKGPMGRKEERPDDHHHLLRAAWEAGITEVPIKKEMEEKGGKKFWKKMKKDKLVYLYDEFGNGPHDPEDLPLDARGLADDPYRDLAGAVRDLGGYRKTHAPFAEFLWAKFFRENVTTHPHKDWDEAVKQAMKLARSKDAKDLPGYRGKKK